MRNEIFRLLEKGKELHEQLVTDYEEILPANILYEKNNLLEIGLTAKINGLLVILNADAKAIKYHPVNTLPQAIELFSDKQIQEDMDKASANKELIGLSPYEDCFITIHEMFEGIKSDIQSILQDFIQYARQSNSFQLSENL